MKPLPELRAEIFRHLVPHHAMAKAMGIQRRHFSQFIRGRFAEKTTGEMLPIGWEAVKLLKAKQARKAK